MKTILKSALTLSLMVATLLVFAQEKTQSFSVSRVIKAPANKVWTAVGEDFGNIANAHPGIVHSEYLSNSLTGGEGVERVCNMNEAGTKYIHEKQMDYDPDNYSFKVQIFATEGIPMDPDLTRAVYKITPIDDNSCKLEIDMTYRTIPAFMGVMSKGRFKKTLEGHALAVEHHVLTGEKVNKENFKEIKKQYKS